ncbi:MAG TPA: hypothetical protein VLE89_07075 [Chlamydiales bacterium]|nr:hypothetical protein [Chlamydiales bacterium]
MKKHPSHELPARSKTEMLKDICEIVHFLHTGQRSAADLLIEDLKTRSIFLDEKIQHDVLIFAEQVQFQYDYDPWHKVTPDVQKAADKLIHDLGFKS